MSNIPKIRFKGFTEDWEQRKLGELYGTIGNAFVGTATPYYVEIGHFYLESNNVKDGQINHNSEIFINDEFYEKQKDKWLHTGDMVMVQSGHVGHAAVIPKELDNTAAHALIMFRNKKEKIEPYFLNYEYQTEKAKKKIENITTGNTIKHILASDMREFEVDVPKYEEQKVIAGYFRKLDNLITLHQRKYDETTELKKYMLKKMFPEKNKNVPEIRFPEFTEEWETCTFGELADYKKGPFGSALKKDIFIPKSDNAVKVYEQQNAINKDWHLERYFITKEYAEKMSGFKVQGGDIIVSCAGTIGETYEIPMDADSGIINQALMKISVNEKMVDKKMFIILFTNMIDDFTRVHSNGSAIKNIPPFSDLKPMKVFVPGMEEQMKISSYFSNLDHLLTLHQQKIDELTELKKYMLQNMFPKKEG